MAFTRAGPNTFGTPALTLTTANAPGSAATAIRTDADVLAFDTTSQTPIRPFLANVNGSVGVASHRDHRHSTAMQREWFALGRLMGH